MMNCLSLMTWESSLKDSKEAVNANYSHKLPTQFCLFSRNALYSQKIKGVTVDTNFIHSDRTV